MPADGDEPRPRPRRFRCPFCGSDRKPWYEEKVSTGGWIVFAFFLVVFFPLCWLGLLDKEEVRYCRDCGPTLP